MAGIRHPIANGVAIGALLLLAGCSAAKDQPGTIDTDQARQLNEAAAMLDANSVDANTVFLDDDESNGS